MFKKIYFSQVVIGLLAINIIINCLNSVTISPFFHSGMYSESFAKADSLEVFEITVNGKKLHGMDFGIYKWDMIHAPLMALNKQQSTNDFDFEKTITKKSLNSLGLNKLTYFISDNLANNHHLISQFPSWYKAYLNKILGYPIQSLRIDKHFVRYQNGKYISLKKEKWIIV